MSVTMQMKRVPQPNQQRATVAAALLVAIKESRSSEETVRFLYGCFSWFQVAALVQITKLAENGHDGIEKTFTAVLRCLATTSVEVMQAAKEALCVIMRDIFPIHEILEIIFKDEKERDIAIKVLYGQLECLERRGGPESRLIRLYHLGTHELPDNTPLVKTKKVIDYSFVDLMYFLRLST